MTKMMGEVRSSKTEYSLPITNGATMTSGLIKQADREAFWANADVYDVAARRVANAQHVASYPAREVLDLHE